MNTHRPRDAQPLAERDLHDYQRFCCLLYTSTETCMAVRLREGFTLTTILPERKLLIQCYSERAHLLWQDTVEDVFSSGKGREV